MKKFLALILVVSLLIPSIPVQASTITERDLINLISESSDTLENYEFTDETAAYEALESAQMYVNTLSGNLDEVYNNLSSEMNALKLNDTSVDIPRIGEINKTYGINVDSLIPIIKEAEETNSGITWITGEVIYPEDLFFYMYCYGINSIEVTLTDTNISDVINICEYASSTDMSICINGKEDSLLSGYNVFYKNDMVVDKKVKTLTDQEMVNYILSNIYTDEIFYYNSDTLITTASTSNIIKAFNPVYLKYGTVNGDNANMFTISDDDYEIETETLYTISIDKLDKDTNTHITGINLTLTNSSNNVVATWTTSDKSYVIENLPADTYTVSENSTLTDYELSDSMNITLSSDGTSDTDYIYYSTKKNVVENNENTTQNQNNQETVVENKETVTIGFITNTSQEINDIVIEKGTKLSNIPTPVRENYKFQGWYNGDTLLTTNLVINKDMVFMASWTSIYYNINYILDGGSNNYNNVNSTPKKVVTFYDPIKIGYTFEGWYLSPNFAGNKVTSMLVDKDITIYAKWKKNITPTYTEPVNVTVKNNEAKTETKKEEKVATQSKKNTDSKTNNTTKTTTTVTNPPEITPDKNINKWVYTNNKWYYYNSVGVRENSCYRDGCWLNSDGSWDPNYSSGKWMCNSTGWWYEDSGWYPVNYWLKIDGDWYYFDATGYMVSSRWIGNYYLTSSGAMATSTWIDGWYVGSDGAWIP